MDRYGFGHAPLLRDTSVIGMEARSPPPLTDYSYHLVRFHKAIICLHTPPTLGMADFRNTHYTVCNGGKCLSPRKRKVVCQGSSSHRGTKVTLKGIFIQYISEIVFIADVCLLQTVDARGVSWEKHTGRCVMMRVKLAWGVTND